MRLCLVVVQIILNKALCSSADVSHDSWLHPSLHVFVLLPFAPSSAFTFCAFISLISGTTRTETLICFVNHEVQGVFSCVWLRRGTFFLKLLRRSCPHRLQKLHNLSSLLKLCEQQAGSPHNHLFFLMISVQAPLLINKKNSLTKGSELLLGRVFVTQYFPQLLL